MKSEMDDIYDQIKFFGWNIPTEVEHIQIVHHAHFVIYKFILQMAF
jgi:hypothetical protein